MELLRLVRAVIIVLLVVTVAAIGALVTRAIGIGYLAGTVAGALMGLVLGTFLASLVTMGMEWMAQVLVAQGELIAAVKASSEPRE